MRTQRSPTELCGGNGTSEEEGSQRLRHGRRQSIMHHGNSPYRDVKRHRDKLENYCSVSTRH